MLTLSGKSLQPVVGRRARQQARAVTFVVQPGEIVSLAQEGQQIWVQAGCAWLTMDGRDYLLNAGERLVLGEEREAVVVSAVAGVDVRIRVWWS